MKLSVAVSAFLLHILTAVANPDCVKRDEANVRQQLSPLLSEDAVISFPFSESWDELTERASTPRIAPDYIAVVEVATEKDVQQTIKIANLLKLPFLAVTGTHGWTSALEKVKNGIQINMRKLNSSSVHSDGSLATVGGGVMQHEITAALFEQNKQTVTGLCECVSAIGPLLGGGHSMLQSKYGFAADNLVSARVVLADGKAVTASASENEDLFWALRGAGHNFGIVTSFDVKVSDVAQEGWTMTAFTFSEDKLESFFDTWNQLEETYEDPGLLVLNGVILRDPTVDNKNPVVNLALLHDGSPTEIDAYAAAFRSLDPLAEFTQTNIPYNELYDVGGFGLSSPVCRKNENILGYPNSFTKWDGKAMRKGFKHFAQLTAEEPFTTSAWLMESYGRKGPQSVDEASTAVAPEERRRHLLTSPMLWWQGDDSKDEKKAIKVGKQIQEAIRPKGEPHTYVNYAVGGEPLPETYGREKERVKKLKDLKKKWDPSNKFGFYAPIA